jgi:hypothetical protein
MKPTEIAKPLGVFALVIVVVLGGTAIVSLAAGSGSSSTADGQNIDGQSPAQYQPDAVNAERDPETGNLSVSAPEGQKRILIDTAHSNRFSQDEIEPIIEALVEAGHEVDVGTGTSGGFSTGGYNATLQQYDAVLVIAPEAGFAQGERIALQNYAAGDGRVVVLGEPTQPAVAEGSFGLTLATAQFGANEMAGDFGARMGAHLLYNLDDEHNDNNFMSINAEPTGDGMLTDGVETVTFDRSGYLVTTGDDVETLYTAADGTRTLERDQTGEFPLVVRNESVVFVADSNFVQQSELYDADNEVFVSNLLEFMVSGDKPDDVPEVPEEEDDGF